MALTRFSARVVSQPLAIGTVLFGNSWSRRSRETAVLEITEALTVFFIGKDTVQKLAPSNAAGRLLGGDILHALCQLPSGNARLISKKGFGNVRCH